MLLGHGDDSYKYKQKIVSNFSSNVLSNHDISALEAFLCSKVSLIRSYPEPDAKSLVVALANKHNVAPQNIAVTNGATEAIYLIAQAYAGKHSTIIIPTFSEYEDACRLHNHTIDRCSDLTEIEANTNLVWFCNPNNPNGRIYNASFIKEIVSQNPDKLFIIDQSYESFTFEPIWSVAEALAFNNVIQLHSMTKKYVIPGLRLGYTTANSEIINHILSHKMPWSVNRLAIEAGLFLLKGNGAKLDLAAYLQESLRLQQALSTIEGITVIPSKTHFFLCKLNKRKASQLKDWLVENHGLLIRDAANFEGLNEHYFRIAAQTPAENDTLIKAIKEWI